MRKSLLIWLTFCMLLSILVIPAVVYADEYSVDAIRYAEVVTPKGTLNMRAEAKDGTKIINHLSKGSIVTILEDKGEWTKINYQGKTGYVKTSFLQEIKELPYSLITKETEGEAVLAFKRKLCNLGYLKSDDINKRFDKAMEIALIKLQLQNEIELNPTAVTSELQALLEWGKIAKGKSGYYGTATDTDSGLVAAIFCWDSGGTLYEEDKSVKVEVTFAAQATGGHPPYTITVKKSLGSEQSGDEVTSPFSFIWSQTTECIYLYAVVVDSAGNTATASTPFRYTLPERYSDDGLG